MNSASIFLFDKTVCCFYATGHCKLEPCADRKINPQTARSFKWKPQPHRTATKIYNRTAENRGFKTQTANRTAEIRLKSY